MSTFLDCLPEIVGACLPFPEKILVIPREDRSFLDRSRIVQEHLHAISQVQFVDSLQVQQSPDCKHFARELKRDILKRC